jgi:hypothetical protein
MQDGISGGWAREPHLSPEHLNSVRGLNARFLDLAGGAGHGWEMPRTPGGLPLLGGGVAEMLASLSPLQRAAVASCPYALFDLRFEDEVYWTARLTRAVQYRVADEPADRLVLDFVQLAIFYAWHVAHTSSLAAQFLLGMSPATVEALRGLAVNSLPALADSEASNLSARWRHSAAYWSALIGAAARADTPALRRVQLHGLQLAAAARLP